MKKIDFNLHIELIFFLLITISLISLSCATLTPGGKKVRYATKAEAPSGCTELDEVSDGAFSSSSIKNVKINMRNNVAKMRGNFLVIDTIEKTCSRGTCGYAGTGRAYRCPPE